MFDNLKRFFGDISEVNRLRKTEQVMLQVPSNADYVTVGPVATMADYNQILNKINRGNPVHSFGFIPDGSIGSANGDGQRVCYLVLTDTALSLIRKNRVTFSCLVTDLATMYCFDGGGFVLSLRDGRGLAVTTPTGVFIPPGASFRSAPVSAEMSPQGNWDIELAARGIITDR